MLSLSQKVQSYLGRFVDFESEVKLANNVDTDFKDAIVEWNVKEPKPTQAQLDAATDQTYRAMTDWEKSMQETDSGMPRYAEDILDGMADKSGVAQITLDRLQAKKDKRGEMP